MTWFHSFRGDHGFTFYGDQTSPESLDKPLVAVVYICVLLSGATLIATLGIRGREKWSHAVRASYAVAIGSSILLCLMSHNWMEGKITIKAPFVYRSNMHFSGDLAVQIGLKSANITLEGTYMSPSGGRDVYYVETIPWPKYGYERLCYQHQLQRGLPAPILRVMDFLTYQHGDLQWGKSYHTAGQYAWGLLWTSFVFWLLSNLLLFSVVVYGAYLFFLSGVTLLMACVAFSQTLNPQPLHMTFGPDVLQLQYGWSFWLAMVAGCLTTILGILLIVTDHFIHSKVAEFFHLEKMVEEEESSAKEDSSLPIHKQRFYTDARGSLASSHSDSRRGSIFLDPSRQTKWMMNPSTFITSKGNPFGSHGIANGNGIDPNTKETNGYDGNSPFRLSSRSKSESFISEHGKPHRNLFNSRMSVSNDRKPSLATLKEHRENHVNEQKFNSSQSSSTGNSLDSHVAPSLTRSLNDVDGNRFSLQRQSSRFMDEAARSIRQRLSAPTVVENSVSPDLVHRQTSNPEYSSNNGETVVEVVVENRHRHLDDEEDGFQPRHGRRDSRLENGRMDEIDIERRQINSDSSSSVSEDCCRKASRSSGSIYSSPGDDAVFTLSFSRNSSRQASEGEEGTEVASHDILERQTDTLSETDRKVTEIIRERQVSLPIGEI